MTTPRATLPSRRRGRTPARVALAALGLGEVGGELLAHLGGQH